jgi:hypothetical protein
MTQDPRSEITIYNMLDIARKLPLDGHDIIVDKVAASWDNKHLVAVTSNNMVSPPGQARGGRLD